MADLDQKNRKLRPHRKRLWLKWKPEKKPRHLQKLPTSWSLIKLTAVTIWRNKGLLLGITAIYAVLHLLLVRGFSGLTDPSTIKSTLGQAFDSQISGITASLGVFIFLASTSTSADANASSSTYQLVLIIIVSLALIWALRQISAHHPVTFKRAYYEGMRPLVPYILVLLFVIIQLIPAAVGALIYVAAINKGIAVYWYEYIATFVIVGLLMAWTIRMLTASLIATYIVTLPGMTPVKAVRSSYRLVRFRRWDIIIRMIALVFILIGVAAVIMVPIILLVPVAATIAFYVLTILILTIFHTYLYGLYRELINHAP